MKVSLLWGMAVMMATLCSSAPAMAQTELPEIPNSQNILTEENEYPITFYGEGAYYSSSGYISSYHNPITAVVTVDADATLIYSSHYIHSVEIDGVEVRNISEDGSGYGSWHNYSLDLTAGEHSIVWKPNKSYSEINDVAVFKTNTISVNLREPGSLGVEALYHVDNLKQVRHLKVTGKMNSDDWEKLHMMNNLISVDLSDAATTDGMIPESSFFDLSSLSKVILPNDVTSIGVSAFFSTMIEEIELPSQLTSIPSQCFAYCFALKSVTLPHGLKTIDEYAFEQCVNLQSITLPEGLEEIGNAAFEYCRSLRCIVIPKSVSSIGWRAFDGCGLEDVTVSGKIHKLYDMFGTTYGVDPHIKTLRLNSPTKVTNSRGIQDLPNAKLIVPEHLVSEYKLDPIWYNFGTIEGFSNEEINDWTINNPLVLNNYRLNGDITINGNSLRMPSLKVFGQDAMDINNLTFDADPNFTSTYYIDNAYVGQMISNCENITIAGDVNVKRFTNAGYWYFLSMPFDVRVSDIQRLADGAQAAVRYYDGASRAAGEAANWKDYASDAIIPAGTGFIYRTSKDTWNVFKSVDNANKLQVVNANDYVKPLVFSASEVPANAGWNLVGNPWQCYYNNHGLNFTAPITVWSAKDKTYNAYSLTDDDYAIKPNESFFVQATATTTEIGFPILGRQFSTEIEWQNPNATPALNAEMANRQLVNLVLSYGDLNDRTRVVLNEQATMSYDAQFDASKFMSMATEAPQLFSLVNSQRLAINERPEADGTVRLGFYAPETGSYTIDLTCCDVQQADLIDGVTGQNIDLTQGAYTFEASKGTDESRFTLVLHAVPAGIEHLNSDATVATYVTIDGRVTSADAKGMTVRVQNGMAQKVFTK